MPISVASGRRGLFSEALQNKEKRRIATAAKIQKLWMSFWSQGCQIYLGPKYQNRKNYTK
jgi:hypothetical protein